jgi:hypothetical protein
MLAIDIEEPSLPIGHGTTFSFLLCSRYPTIFKAVIVLCSTGTPTRPVI